ncbi:MAG: cytochrome c biogenesis protein CcsA [Saprospiraceae bacterium]
MQYLDEHLLPGQLGHLCAVLSFVAALLASVSFFLATQRRETAQYKGWRNLGRYAYLLHGLATFGIIGVLFWILTGKMYEYHYAWANVSDDLPVQYVFSAFWKEQQGSFLLWSFWHIVLGVVLMFRAGKWETSVLAVIALAEVFIASMLLGLYFNEFRLGASPFDLLRNVMTDPIFDQAGYLAKIKGNGLNPLLQNYWMTIHPPTLFLGFASTIVPFSYAIAGLWMRQHKEWLKPALSWSLFSATILGTGILMGGAWAYEALSFAGYWAWDPVENTSLVPWLTLLAGIHTNLIARNTGYSIRSTYGFYLLTFILILYSTYLTRSGVLGDTSVHSFTEMGLGFQLLMFIGGFSVLGILLWAIRYREVPEMRGEESTSSREFWMFIGSLVLLFSVVLMTGATSLPVWNKIVQIFNPDYIGAALKDPMEHHNKYQLGIAVLIGLLTGLAQWMRYAERSLYKDGVPMLSRREKSWVNYTLIAGAILGLYLGFGKYGIQMDWMRAQTWTHLIQNPQTLIELFLWLLLGVPAILLYLIYFIKRRQYWTPLAKKMVLHIGVALAGAAALTALNAQWIDINAWQFYTFLFAGMFSLVSNLDYLITVLKGNLKLAGSAVSHMGFGILLLGILSTGLGKDWVSVNTFAMEGLIEGADDELLRRSVILMKDAPMPMRGFNATYTKDTVERQTRTFAVNFQRRDKEGNLTGENFTLYPNVMYDRRFSEVVANNPSTQHYWNYDLFTLVSSLPKGELDPEFAKQQEDSLRFEKYEAMLGDTIFTKKHYLVLERVTKAPKHPEYHAEKGDLAVGLELRAYSLGDPKPYPAAPMLYIRPAQGGFSLPANVGPLQMRVRLNEASMEHVFNTEAALQYSNFGVKQGGAFEFNGYQIKFVEAIKDVQHPSYAPEPGDIAVAAGLQIIAPDGQKAEAAPVYLIRDSQPFSLKDEAPSMGLHFRFENIDPANGILTIGVAASPANQPGIPLEIAENAARSDYIVLEAIIFPGINLVWLGCIMMLLGIALSLWKRLKS